MAIQFTDFSRAPIQESPLKSLFEDAFKGYSMSQIPAKLKAEQQQRELSNQLRTLEVEHKPKEYALNDQQKSLANSLQELALQHRPKEYSLSDAYKQSQIDRNMRTSAVGAKANGKLANFMVSHPNATQEEITDFADTLSKAELKHLESVSNRSQDITQGSSFDKQPANVKKQLVGLMAGMGVDPLEAASMLRKGVTPTEYAEQNGIDISTVTPNYPLGEQNIKDIQRTDSYFKEMDSLEKNITSGLGEYQNKIKGFSLEQIADQLAGDKPEKVGKALAARALLPELSALRLKVQGGNIGIEAIRELEAKSLGNLRVVEGLVDQPTYNAMQRYMTEWLHEAGDRRIKALEGFGQLKGKLKQGSEKVFDLGAGGFE